MTDDSVSVLSPEGVSLELPIAGPGPRILAYAIDFVLVFGFGILLVLLLLTLAVPISDWLSGLFESFSEQLEKDPGDPSRALLALLPVYVALVLFLAMNEVLYFIFAEFVTGGRSPGKMLLGLRVTSDTGLPLELRSSLVRNLLRLVDVLPSSYAVGLTSMMLTERWQRLGDIAAGTVVIRTDRLQPEGGLDPVDRLEPLQLNREQLSRLGAPELALIRGTLRRLDRVEPERADRLVLDAIAALRRRLELEIEREPEAAADGAIWLRRLLSAASRDARRL